MNNIFEKKVPLPKSYQMVDAWQLCLHYHWHSSEIKCMHMLKYMCKVIALPLCGFVCKTVYGFYLRQNLAWSHVYLHSQCQWQHSHSCICVCFHSGEVLAVLFTYNNSWPSITTSHVQYPNQDLQNGAYF